MVFHDRCEGLANIVVLMDEKYGCHGRSGPSAVLNMLCVSTGGLGLGGTDCCGLYALTLDVLSGGPVFGVGIICHAKFECIQRLLTKGK